MRTNIRVDQKRVFTLQSFHSAAVESFSSRNTAYSRCVRKSTIVHEINIQEASEMFEVSGGADVDFRVRNE